MKSIVFAGGCFWGVQAYFNQVEGVEFTEVGYANGKTISPSHEEVTNGSGHAEAVAVYFDSDILPTRRLINLFFDMVDASAITKNGLNKKSQYRAAIFWQTNAQEALIVKEAEIYLDNVKTDITLDIKPLRNFYRAEDVHQDYLEKNPKEDCYIPKEMLNKPIPATP